MTYLSYMTPEDLAKAGTYLYGKNWQTPLASALGMTSRTIRRYYAGEKVISKTVRLAIEQVLQRAKENKAPPLPAKFW